MRFVLRPSFMASAYQRLFSSVVFVDVTIKLNGVSRGVSRRPGSIFEIFCVSGARGLL
jgi:hypothetical protein